jgi:hypothetical protein
MVMSWEDESSSAWERKQAYIHRRVPAAEFHVLVARAFIVNVVHRFDNS